jgi:hypothetical protein
LFKNGRPLHGVNTPLDLKIIFRGSRPPGLAAFARREDGRDNPGARALRAVYICSGVSMSAESLTIGYRRPSLQHASKSIQPLELFCRPPCKNIEIISEVPLEQINR